MEFVHCNLCHLRKQDRAQFFLTSCGHIFCIRCIPPQQTDVLCPKCSQQCTLLSLSSKFQQVETFFRNPVQICSDIQKQQEHLQRVLEFQASHQASLFSHVDSECSTNHKHFERKVRELQEERQYWKKLFSSAIQSSYNGAGYSDVQPSTPEKSAHVDTCTLRKSGRIPSTPTRASCHHQGDRGVKAVRGPPMSPYVTSSVPPSPSTNSSVGGRRKGSQIVTMEKLLNQKDKELTALRAENRTLLEENGKLREEVSQTNHQLQANIEENCKVLEELKAEKEKVQEDNRDMKNTEEHLTQLLQEGQARQCEYQQKHIDLEVEIGKITMKKDEEIEDLRQRVRQTEARLGELQTSNNDWEKQDKTVRRIPPHIPHQDGDSSPELVELQLDQNQSALQMETGMKTPVTPFIIHPAFSKTPGWIKRTPARSFPQMYGTVSSSSDIKSVRNTRQVFKSDPGDREDGSDAKEDIFPSNGEP